MDLIDLFRLIVKARAFELAIADLWQQGLISGEMHLGTGEEAIAAGVAAQMREGDAAALDHRSTPMMTILGVDMTAMIREMLGRADGLCHGQGGHMHLMAPDRLLASSGIVGSAGPLAVGFALAATRLRPGSVALAFFGDGAANQGMLLESLNLASSWSLPVVFVCKDNGWAISTRSASVTGGELVRRAEAFGLAAVQVDGMDVMEVWRAVEAAFARARKGRGPTFLHATCRRLDGHFLGDLMVRAARSPVAEGGEIFGKVLGAVFSRGGGGIGSRAASMAHMMGLLGRVRGDHRDGRHDPVVRTRRQLKKQQSEVEIIEQEVTQQVSAAVEAALQERAP